MTLQHQEVLDQEDMFQKVVPYHHRNKISPDGHFQKQVVRQLISPNQIGIKHMIRDRHLEPNVTPKIRLGQWHILVQVIGIKEID